MPLRPAASTVSWYSSPCWFVKENVRKAEGGALSLEAAASTMIFAILAASCLVALGAPALGLDISSTAATIRLDNASVASAIAACACASDTLSESLPD